MATKATPKKVAAKTATPIEYSEYVEDDVLVEVGVEAGAAQEDAAEKKEKAAIDAAFKAVFKDLSRVYTLKGWDMDEIFALMSEYQEKPEEGKIKMVEAMFARMAG